MKIQLGSRSIRYFREKDIFCINRAEKRQQVVEKKRMEAVKWHKAAAQHQLSASEGRTYQAGDSKMNILFHFLILVTVPVGVRGHSCCSANDICISVC